MTTDDMRPGDGLLIVDVQVDFCPGGALPIPYGDRVVPVLNEWIDAALARGVPVLASRDWHPVAHPSFLEQGGDWPPHCIQDTSGAWFHPGLRLPADATLISKGTRFDFDQLSAFHETGLHTRLRGGGVDRLWIGGLAQDVCVSATALEGRAHGFDVMLIPDGSLPVRVDEAAASLDKLKAAGVLVAAP